MAPHFETESGEKIGFFHNTPQPKNKGEQIAAQAQHNLAEKWVWTYKKGLIEVADGRGEPTCNGLPHSYPAKTTG